MSTLAVEKTCPLSLRERAGMRGYIARKSFELHSLTLILTLSPRERGFMQCFG
jgi:hypothetical protein